MKYYTVTFWNNLKRKELTFLASNRYHARLLAIDTYHITKDSIIQIKEYKEV